MDEATRQARLRALPSIDELLVRPSLLARVAGQPRPVVVAAAREAVARVRARLLAGEDVALTDADFEAALTDVAGPRLRPVINATGVVLHTNLGRAPLAVAAVERIAQVARGYANLELDLDNGERGSRYEPVVGLLRSLTGAEAALVVNNCAAAVVLALSALASGMEAIVSRGELVEIGGGFRVPDVMRQSGATLVEVGTTNRTRLRDYEAALTERTGVLVKVHRSNFAIVGFSEEASVRELAGLAAGRGVPLMVDLGSGALVPLHGEGLSQEPTVASVVSAGADVVAFSGDKLLGGPQAGILVGRRAVIDRLAAHPLNRALRVDKLTVAALEATLALYRDGVADEAVPTRAMIQARPEVLEARARRLAGLLSAAGLRCRLVRAEGKVGGGSMPLAVLPSWAVALEGGRAEAWLARLRAGAPPVIGRIEDDEVWLDVRCVADGELEVLAQAVVSAR